MLRKTTATLLWLILLMPSLAPAAADYSPRNVPFTPKRFLEIEPRGAGEGDFVFLLGYPGRTYRHYPASYLAYDEEVRMPYIADWYAWQIDLMEKMGRRRPRRAAPATGTFSRISAISTTGCGRRSNSRCSLIICAAPSS